LLAEIVEEEKMIETVVKADEIKQAQHEGYQDEDDDQNG